MDKNFTKPPGMLDSSIVVRAEGSKSVAKKAWIHAHMKLPKETKLKLRKEIEELNKKFDEGKMGK